MSDRAEQAFQSIVDDLHGAGRLRVWSIIITVFGDLVPPDGTALPAAALQAILDRLRIDGGTVRTAVSRLAKDGWIERERDGRNISYRLTDAARPAFDAASRTIYAPRRPAPEGPVRVLAFPEKTDPTGDSGLLPLRRGLWLWPAPEGDVTARWPEAMELCAATPLPPWALKEVADPALLRDLVRLQMVYAPLAAALAAGDTVLPVTAAAARAALIHTWRRIALRHPNLPDMALPHDWPEPDVRRFVLTLHHALTPGAEHWQRDILMPAANDVLQDSG